MKRFLLLPALLAMFQLQAQQIEEYRYWINDDPAGVTVIGIGPDVQVNLVSSLVLPTLTKDYNMITIQFKDTNEVYSVPVSRIFTRNTGPVTGYEYWFDDDIANRTAGSITAGTNVDLTSNFGQCLAAGSHIFTIRFAGASGTWSVPITRQFTSTGPSDADGDGLCDLEDPCPLAVDGIANFNTSTCNCDAGYFQETTSIGANTVITGCTICPPGFFCPDGLVAVPCPAGTFSSLSGQQVCSACPVNTYNPNEGQTECLACAFGESSGLGATECTPDGGCTAYILELQSGGTAPNAVTYEVLDETGTATILSGNNPVPANSIGTLTLCLNDGCYQLRVTDNAGDGLAGYILRESGANARRIIDNANNMSDGVSQISNGQTFCLPISDDRPIYSSCDKLDWVTNKFIVASENTAVSAQYGVTNTTSGYVFWFYDPNGSYSYRRFRSHATSDGFGTGALRANHFRLNAWTNTPSSPHLPEGVLLNVRIRARIAGVNQEWGPACRFKMDAALAACPRVNLEDNPNNNEYSCGVSRGFGGANSWTNRLTATPPQPIPTVSSGNVRYQFRFRVPGENICIIRPPQTSPRIYLNWSAASGPQLECSKQYDVDVRVSLDGGASWCFDVAAPSCVEPVTPWGTVCVVNITNSPNCTNAQGGSSSIAMHNEGTLTLYPNPNRGDQLFVNLTEVTADVNTVSVDIFDLTGKRISARVIAVQDGFVKTNIDLNGELASGMYMVNITAGEQSYTERLVIQK